MALERSVLMDDGKVYRYHVVTSIKHVANTGTYVDVMSYVSSNQTSNGYHNIVVFDLNDSMTFSEAEAEVASMPDYAEYEFDSDAELQNMQEQVDSLSSELTSTQAQATETNSKLQNVLVVLTDDQALEFSSYFPVWAIDISYNTNDRVLYNESLYKCVQAHTSQADWTPDAVQSLWTNIAMPGTIAEWVQPTGAQDAYQTGDQVTHNGYTWTSTIDSNVWEPGVYGWEQINE